jgi:hypothetical protein
VPIEGYALDFNILNGHDCWNPLQRGVPAYHESNTYGIFDVYSAKRPDRSRTWPGGNQDSVYGSQSGEGTTPSMSVSSCLDSRTEISWTPDDCSSYTDGVTNSRQPRTKSVEDNKLRCTRCPWVGKTPSEKRFSNFCVVFFHRYLT